MFDYDRIASVALRQIERFGLAITLTHRTPGTYNNATSTSTPSEVVQTAQGVLDNYRAAEIDGTMIQQGDIKIILSAIGITRPTNSDLATLADGTRYTIKAVEIIAPGGSPVLYICQGRK